MSITLNAEEAGRMTGTMTQLAGRSSTSQRLGLLAVLVLLLGLVLPLAPSAEATHALGTPDDVTTDRYGGENRFDTAGLIADDVSGGNAPDVLLARADLYPDTLSGNFLAGVRGDPVLLMPQDFLFEDTMGWLETLGTENITILGGVEAITADNEERLEDEGYNVDRIGGETRFETAKLISERAADEGAVGTWDGERTAIVASGENFPDALVSGALGFSENFPVLLTNTDFLTDYTEQALDNLDIERAIIPGGSAAVSQNAEDEIQDMGIATTRVNGRTRVTTATEFADFVQTEFGWTYELINIARGDLFPDALTVGPLAGSAEAPLLLTYDPDTLGASTLDNGEHETGPWLREHACEILGLHFAGGIKAITEDTAEEADAAAEDCGDAPTQIDVENVGSDTNLVGEDHTVQATVTQTDDDPSSDVEVRFEVTRNDTATGEPDSGSGTTDANGETTFTYTNDAAGQDTITACFDFDGSLPDSCAEADRSDTVAKTWVERIATTLDADPENADNVVGDTHTVTVDVRDQDGDELGGVTVRLLVEAGPNDGETDTATTEANGDATLEYVGDDGVGQDEILVWADSDGDNEPDAGEPSDEVLKNWEIGDPDRIDLEPETAVNPVDTTHTVTATVFDRNDNRVPDAGVFFEVTGTVQTDGDDTTDGDGEATFAYSSSDEGFDFIVACAQQDGDVPTDCPDFVTAQSSEEDLSDGATKEWQEPVASSLDLAPEDETNEVGSQHTVTATVLDQFDRPMQGETVQFEVTGTHMTSDTDTTDENGQATFTYPDPADGQTGTDTITACMAPGPCADEAPGEDDNSDLQDAVTKTWESTPEQLTLDDDEATNTVGDQHTVTATVVDGFGQPVQGAVVLFQVEATEEPATTNASGQAAFTYSTTEAGDDTITACTTEDGDTPDDCPTEPELTDTQTKHWDPGAPAMLDIPLAQEEVTNTAPAETTHTVTADVTDEFGNPVPNVTVLFEVTGTQGESEPQMTDSTGTATFTYFYVQDGDDQITACTTQSGTPPGTCPDEPATPDDDDLVDRVIKHWRSA